MINQDGCVACNGNALRRAQLTVSSSRVLHLVTPRSANRQRSHSSISLRAARRGKSSG
jgi:hypothetical protein